MSTHVKPCRRPSCPRHVQRKSARALDKARFCSNRCRGLHLAATTPGGLIPREAQRRGGQLGGTRGGVTRERLAIQRRLEDVRSYFSAAVFEAMSREDQRRLRVLIARVFRDGKTAGYRVGVLARDRMRRPSAA